MRITLVLLAFWTSFLTGAPPAPKDHPLISPYQGSKIMEHTTTEFDAISFPLDAIDKKDYAQLTLEGKIDRVSYKNPPERSTLEIFRNYQSALKSAGFTTLREATGKAQLGFGHHFISKLGLNNTSFCYDPDPEKTRFLIAKKARPTGDLHVVVLVPQCKPDPKTILWIVETKPMQTDQVTVNAAAMAEALEREGHVALYGILFDLDRAEIRPDAVPTLTEIAKLLDAKKPLKIYVVGHTDMQGNVKYNMDLSQKRAEAVVKWLTGERKVAPARLQAFGVGPLAPKATNRTDEGRALNRRVELIERLD